MKPADLWPWMKPIQPNDLTIQYNPSVLYYWARRESVARFKKAGWKSTRHWRKRYGGRIYRLMRLPANV